MGSQVSNPGRRFHFSVDQVTRDNVARPMRLKASGENGRTWLSRSGSNARVARVH